MGHSFPYTLCGDRHATRWEHNHLSGCRWNQCQLPFTSPSTFLSTTPLPSDCGLFAAQVIQKSVNQEHYNQSDIKEENGLQ